MLGTGVLNIGQVFELRTKLFSITTDGAPAMRRKIVEIVKLKGNLLNLLLLFFRFVNEDNLFA